jgi:hypothetical protein
MKYLAVLVLLATSMASADAGVKLYGAAKSAVPVGGGDWAADFGACTVGTDCFCDLITTTGTVNGAYSNVFFCEDWDHDALWEDTANITMPGGYGDWADGSTTEYGSNNRGRDSWWRMRYGREGDGIPNGQPSTPTVGLTCAIGFPCDQVREYRSDNRYLANYTTDGMPVDIIRPGEFDDEIGNIDPVIPSSGGATVFGNAILAARNGTTTTSGTYGSSYGDETANSQDFDGIRSQFGITAAVGYSDNITASQILLDAWKHDEFKPSQQGDVQDGLFGFNSTSANPNTWPVHFPIVTGPAGYDDCGDNILAGTNHVGGGYCADQYRMVLYATEGTGAGQFSSSADLLSNLDEWHCFSVYWDFRTVSNVTMKAWWNGELVVHYTGLDFSGSQVDSPSGADGYNAFSLNNYANRVYYTGPLVSPVRRYNDNYVMRDGTPVLCEDLGFPDAYNQAGL